MANNATEGMDKILKNEVLRLLKEQIDDPTSFWIERHGLGYEQYVAGRLLKSAGYLSERGTITLAGIDYYREQTANPVMTWIRANAFPFVIGLCTTATTVTAIVTAVWS